MKRRVLTTLAIAAAATALLVPVSSAGAGPAANASGEELLTFVDTGKLKVSKNIRIQMVCAVNCSLNASFTTKAKGVRVENTLPTATFPAGQIAEAVLSPNKALRNAIKDDIKKAKIIADVSAVNIATGEIDDDSQTFKFKK